YKEGLLLNEFFIGIGMATNGVLIALFEMVIIHSLEGKKHILQYISLGTLLLGLAFAMFNVFPGAGLLALLSMIVVTVGETLAMQFMNTYWSGRANLANRGQYAALFTVAWSVALILGPLLGTQIADHLGFVALWWIAGGVGTV